MRLCNRSVVAAALAVSVGGGLAGIRAATLDGSSVQRLDEEHWKYPHMHHAMDSLREARKSLDEAEDVFHGHKQDAIDHVEMALKEIRAGLKEQSDESAMPTQLPQPTQLDEKYPHLRVALEKLKDARAELENADKVFAGHREHAIDHIDKAIKQIEDGIHND